MEENPILWLIGTVGAVVWAIALTVLFIKLCGRVRDLHCGYMHVHGLSKYYDHVTRQWEVRKTA